MKRVSFCPLALLIGVAAEGEAEPALVRAAQEQLGKRKVAMCAYRCVSPLLSAAPFLAPPPPAPASRRANLYPAHTASRRRR